MRVARTHRDVGALGGRPRPASPPNEMWRAALGRKVGSRPVGAGVAVTRKRWQVQGMEKLYGEVSVHPADGLTRKHIGAARLLLSRSS